MCNNHDPLRSAAVISYVSKANLGLSFNKLRVNRLDVAARIFIYQDGYSLSSLFSFCLDHLEFDPEVIGSELVPGVCDGTNRYLLLQDAVNYAVPFCILFEIVLKLMWAIFSLFC